MKPLFILSKVNHHSFIFFNPRKEFICVVLLWGEIKRSQLQQEYKTSRKWGSLMVIYSRSFMEYKTSILQPRK
jgi:hypothetical protein